MERLTYMIITIAFLMGVAVTFNACKKEKNNQPPTYTDPRNGQIYNTVEIGNQTWLAENLNYETSNSWWINNSSTYGDIYGRLYTWNAALTACPNGWHLPSDDEWKTLEMCMGMSQSEADEVGWRGTDEGKKLKSTSGWKSDGNGTDSVGFTAFPSGFRQCDDYLFNPGFYNTGSGGYWWTDTENSDSTAWLYYLSHSNNKVFRARYTKENGYSVRCVRD